MHVCFLHAHTVDMRPLSKVFDGSTSLFETQRVLCNSIGMAFGWFIPPQYLVDDVGQ
jgi:hypothetical protein